MTSDGVVGDTETALVMRLMEPHVDPSAVLLVPCLVGVSDALLQKIVADLPGVLFSLVPLVWESNPKLQGVWCKPNHQPIRGFDPNHQGIWSPGALLLFIMGPLCATMCVFITAVPITKLFARGGGGGNVGHLQPETTNQAQSEQ